MIALHCVASLASLDLRRPFAERSLPASRMNRRLVTLIFAFLLLVMQQAEHAHALTHIGEWFHSSHDRALYIPNFESQCGICALFAGGSSAATGSTAATAPPHVEFAIPTFVVASRSVDAPSYYASRAPPRFL